ncbi:hypothetical protein V9T40_004665 [Parthenolecanium corni]|uniref:Uncharacterized protein n=1 Tax=Parthenolecanium corni TaxID=536013 RepID=A0AAN9TCP6_9HEMI
MPGERAKFPHFAGVRKFENEIFISTVRVVLCGEKGIVPNLYSNFRLLLPSLENSTKYLKYLAWPGVAGRGGTRRRENNFVSFRCVALRCVALRRTRAHRF